MLTTDAQLPAAPVAVARPAEWAEPGMGTRLQHNFFYWLMRLAGMVRGYHMANIASGWYVLFYPSIRRRCRFYLARRFPEHRGFYRRFLDTFRMVRSYATTLVDIKVRAMFGSQQLTITNPDHDRLTQLSQSEKGFVLIHAHVGCWQAAMSTLGQFPKKVSIVMIPDLHTMSMFDPQKVTAIDPRTGLQGAMEMTDALLRGDILVMMGDRTIGSEQTVVPAQFLGGTVMLPITPFRMASATGVPVVVMTAPRVGKRSYELRMTAVIDVPPRLGRNPANYAPYSQQFANCIERFVADYPWQFYNFFNMWQHDSSVASASSRQKSPS